jgi:flagellar biosynthesis/type III secretory pathway M-ring protein FliF/YscJ
MRGYLWAACGGLVGFVIGVWLAIAPWVVGFDSGGPWNAATYTSFWTGIGLVVLGLIMAIGFVITAFREQARQFRAREQERAPAPNSTAARSEARADAPAATPQTASGEARGSASESVGRDEIERLTLALLKDLQRERV